MGKKCLRKRSGLQERLDVELQGADGVLKLVFFQHLGMENTEVANDLVFAADAEVDGGGVAWEESGIYRNTTLACLDENPRAVMNIPFSSLM